MILSGGAGTRLWPLSREAAPKPFMPLPDGETLLAQDGRARARAARASRELVTVTNREYYFAHQGRLRGPARADRRRASYLLEPFGRNTAPAVALARAVDARRASATTPCCWCCRPIT